VVSVHYAGPAPGDEVPPNAVRQKQTAELRSDRDGRRYLGTAPTGEIGYEKAAVLVKLAA
jgi:hypothetical protein